ncbi:hypothetical protein [Streptomyces sp. NPDC001833]|uniref:hypothetical protein n=1 Tax=Streptomyces sp. NPDC001833 TaxID=3154658 RepID=UPI00332B1D10
MPLIGTFTRRPVKMALLDLEKTTSGLSKTWSGFLRDPVEVTRAHVEAFQAWMIETRSASTAPKAAPYGSGAASGW